MIRLLVDRLNKDFKLVRCLGMTLKQTMKAYFNIGISFVIYPIVHYMVLYCNSHNTFMQVSYYYNAFMISIIVSLINLIGFMIYAYIKTNSTITFYPSDVERYY